MLHQIVENFIQIAFDFIIVIHFNHFITNIIWNEFKIYQCLIALISSSFKVISACTNTLIKELLKTLGADGFLPTTVFIHEEIIFRHDRRNAIAGITAMQALAATSRTPLVEGTETLALVPVTAGLDTLASVLDAVDTVVAYKGGRRMPEVVATLRSKGRDAVLGVNLGLEHQELIRLTDLDDDATAPYFSTVLAPAARGDQAGGRL